MFDKEKLIALFDQVETDSKKMKQIIKSNHNKSLSYPNFRNNLYIIMFYLFSKSDKESFNQIFNQCLANLSTTPDELDADNWSTLEKVILLYSELNNNSDYIDKIRQRGVQPTRISGEALQDYLQNLASEFCREEINNFAALQRFRSIVCELILLKRVKKKGFFESGKKYDAEIRLFTAKFDCLLENFYAKEDKVFELVDAI